MKRRNGQVMIISTVLIGGAMLAATAVAGLVMYYQIRQSNDAAQSTIAIFAADSGIQEGMYCYYYSINSIPVGSTKYIENTCSTGGGMTYVDKTGTWKPGSVSYNKKLTCYLDDRVTEVACDAKDANGASPVQGFSVSASGTTGRAVRTLETFVYTK